MIETINLLDYTKIDIQEDIIMKRGFLRKALTVLLSFSLVVTSLSIQAYAQEKVSEIELPETEGYSYYVNEKTDTIVISEDDARREVQTKHFRMSDGSLKAVVYSNAVHYKENGQWKDIDNTLEHKEETGTMDQPHWENRSGPFSVSFKDNTSGTFFHIATEEGSLSWGIRGSSDKAEIRITPLEETDDVFAKAVTKTKSQKVSYEDVLPGVSLEYLVNGDGIKENIIISEAQSWKGMTYALELEGLYAEKREDGSIALVSLDSDEVIYELVAPYMYDSNESFPAYSNNVSLDITRINED